MLVPGGTTGALTRTMAGESVAGDPVAGDSAAAEGRSVRDVLTEMDLIPAERIDEVLDVRSMTEPGIPGE